MRAMLFEFAGRFCSIFFPRCCGSENTLFWVARWRPNVCSLILLLCCVFFSRFLSVFCASVSCREATLLEWQINGSPVLCLLTNARASRRHQISKYDKKHKEENQEFELPVRRCAPFEHQKVLGIHISLGEPRAKVFPEADAELGRVVTRRLPFGHSLGERWGVIVYRKLNVSVLGLVVHEVFAPGDLPAPSPLANTAGREFTLYVGNWIVTSRLYVEFHKTGDRHTYASPAQHPG